MTPTGITLTGTLVLLLLGVAVLVLACGGWKMMCTRFDDDLPVPTTITAVEVTGGSGNLEVTTTAGSQVYVHRTVRFLKLFHDRPDDSTQVDGTVLRINTSGGRFWVIDYLIRVPEGMPIGGDLTSGAAQLTGVSNVDIKTSSGNIVLTRVSGAITVGSSSGSIRGEDLRPAVIDATTSSGNIALSLAIPCAVRASTASGNINLGAPGGGYDIDTHTTSGRRRIRVAADPAGPHRLDLRTKSGNITVTPR